MMDSKIQMKPAIIALCAVSVVAQCVYFVLSFRISIDHLVSCLLGGALPVMLLLFVCFLYKKKHANIIIPIIFALQLLGILWGWVSTLLFYNKNNLVYNFASFLQMYWPDIIIIILIVIAMLGALKGFWNKPLALVPLAMYILLYVVVMIITLGQHIFLTPNYILNFIGTTFFEAAMFFFALKNTIVPVIKPSEKEVIGELNRKKTNVQKMALLTQLRENNKISEAFFAEQKNLVLASLSKGAVPKKHCAQCGAENEATAVFCGKCGAMMR